MLRLTCFIRKKWKELWIFPHTFLLEVQNLYIICKEVKFNEYRRYTNLPYNSRPLFIRIRRNWCKCEHNLERKIIDKNVAATKEEQRNIDWFFESLCCNVNTSVNYEGFRSCVDCRLIPAHIFDTISKDADSTRIVPTGPSGWFTIWSISVSQFVGSLVELSDTCSVVSSLVLSGDILLPENTI